MTMNPSQNSQTHDSFETSSEFKAKRDHLFKIKPQQPHLAQLGESSSSSARKGFRLVLDVDFVNLSEKFSEKIDPLEFSKHIGEYSSQIETLELNGYDVARLRDRFDQIKRCLIEVKRIRAKDIDKHLEELSPAALPPCSEKEEGGELKDFHLSDIDYEST